MAPVVATRTQDLALIDLVDALVEAIDIERTEAIDRLREALEPIGATGLFNDELRLNGVAASDLDRICDCAVWL